MDKAGLTSSQPQDRLPSYAQKQGFLEMAAMPVTGAASEQPTTPPFSARQEIVASEGALKARHW